MKFFQLGTRIRLTETFTDLIAGVVTDPTTITLKLHDPNGVETSFTYAGGDITRDSVGVYHYDFAPTVAGKTWRYRWLATGAVVAVDEQLFQITESGFVNP